MRVYPPGTWHHRDRPQSIIAAPLRGDGPDAIDADKPVLPEQPGDRPGEALRGDSPAGSRYTIVAMRAVRGRRVLVLVGEAESNKCPDPRLGASSGSG